MPEFDLIRCRRIAIALAGLLLTVGMGATARAQKKEEVEIPRPRTVVCKATDGLLIRCTYYYGCTKEEEKKNTVPVIIVHDYEEEARDYDALATYLQHQGHAVIVPDLRGHGGSTSVDGGGDFTEMDLNRSLRASVVRMAADVEAAKQFLMQENNKGELNIELLTVVGVGAMGSVVATNWTASDWLWPDLPGRKQGKDVKALCLISPAQSFKGATAREAITRNPFLQNDFQIDSSVALIVGSKDRASNGETRRIHDALERKHKINETLFLVEKDTSLNGRKMLDPALRLGIEGNINKFIELTVQAKKNEYPWRTR